MVRRKNAANAAAEVAKAAAKAVHAAKVASVLVHFTTTYTLQLSRLDAFQQLCTDLDVSVGTSLTQCKKVLDSSFPILYEPHADSFVCRTSRMPTSTSTTSCACSRPEAT
jgi:hypothetical protein